MSLDSVGVHIESVDYKVPSRSDVQTGSLLFRRLVGNTAAAHFDAGNIAERVSAIHPNFSLGPLLLCQKFVYHQTANK